MSCINLRPCRCGHPHPSRSHGRNAGPQRLKLAGLLVAARLIASQQAPARRRSLKNVAENLESIKEGTSSFKLSRNEEKVVKKHAASVEVP